MNGLANNNAKIESYKRGLQLFNKLNKELKELRKNQEAFQEQYEYNLHLYEELDKARFKSDEQLILEQQLDKENNIEEIKLKLKK